MVHLVKSFTKIRPTAALAGGRAFVPEINIAVALHAPDGGLHPTSAFSSFIFN